MGTTRNEHGEISKFTENWSLQFKQLKEYFRNRRNRYSWLKNTSWLMMLLLATTMWQCDKDDYQGETVGIYPEVISTDPADGAIAP